VLQASDHVPQDERQWRDWYAERWALWWDLSGQPPMDSDVEASEVAKLRAHAKAAFMFGHENFGRLRNVESPGRKAWCVSRP
jgi:hypothetical protein